MDLTNLRQSVSCHDRNKDYYVKWCWIYAVVMFLALPADVVTFFLGDGMGWIHIPLTLVGLFALCKWVICLLSIFHPEYGKLGRSLRRYSDGSIHTNVSSMFELIEKDIHENGRQFGKVWVGKEWVLGDEAMRIDRIRGIFDLRQWNTQRMDYYICLIDDLKNDQTTELILEVEMNRLYSYLTSIIPYARRGTYKDYMNFFRMSDAEMEFLNKSIHAID